MNNFTEEVGEGSRRRTRWKETDGGGIEGRKQMTGSARFMFIMF